MIAELWGDAVASTPDKPKDARAPLAAVAGACVVLATFWTRGPTDAAWCVFALGAAWLLSRWVAQFAHAVGVTVLPGGRSVHSRPTPLLGGLAILIPLLVAVFVQGDAMLAGFGVGCLLMATVGAVDDFRGVSPRIKIAAQVLSALVLYGAGFRVAALDIPPLGTFETGAWELALLIGWVVLVTNAINLIDGLDGLASGVGLLGALACAALGYGGVAPFVLAAALIGFLRHNLAPARVFLGDAGSLMVGFALAALLLGGGGPVNVPVAIGILALPLGDVFLAALRRWLRGKPIFTADRGHVHHLLLNTWGSPWRALAALIAFASVHVLVAVTLPSITGLVLSAVVWIAFGVYMITLARTRWSPILPHRRRFKRAHVVRNYATAALALSESRSEIRSVLERVATDFRITFLRLDEIVIRRAPDPVDYVEEVVDCKGALASWRHAPEPEPLVFTEERRAIVCDLIRAAAQRLKGLAAEEERSTGGFALPPEVHFVLSPHDDVEGLRPLVDETRRSDRLSLRVIHTGRRGPSLFEVMEPNGFEPDIHLNGGDDDDAARMCERYRELIDREEPALVVVVGRSDTAVGVAAVAKARGIPVARVGARNGAAVELNDVVASAIADLHVDHDPAPEARTGIVSAFEGLAASRREP